MEDDRFDLSRFVQAQQEVIADVRAELADGRKQTHWMWFVFPQLQELGRSEMARRYGIRSLEEARAYLAHMPLGMRLLECCHLLLRLPAGRSAHDVFGSPDDLKLRSSLTLFQLAAPEEPLFGRCLDRFYGGERDPLTLEICARAAH